MTTRIYLRCCSGLQYLVIRLLYSVAGNAGTAEDKKKVNFEGLSAPPIVAMTPRQTNSFCSADHVGSLEIGLTVFYRRIQSDKWLPTSWINGEGVTFSYFVNTPYDKI